MRLRLLLLLLLMPSLAQAAPCPWVVSPDVSQKLYDLLQALPVSDCALEDQTVANGVVAELWKRDQKPVPLHWAPRACVDGVDGLLQPTDLPAFAAQCPQTAQWLQVTSETPGFPMAVKPIPRGVTQVMGSDVAIVTATAALEVVALLGMLLWLALSLWTSRQLPQPMRRAETQWWQAGLALFALALLMRVLVPPSLSNWYTPVLGLNEVAKADRYGSGHLALQSLLRAVLPWGDRVLFGANQVLGAAIVPLWLVVLRQRKVDLRIAALAAGLLAVLPLHVRLTNSVSEHVLAAFLWLATLAVWQAAVRARLRTGMGALGLLALALALLTALTRVDATAPLAAIFAWTLLDDRPQTPWRHRILAALLWVGIWLLVLSCALPFVQVAVAEQGTPIPHWPDRLQALHDFLPGMRRLLFQPPGWIGPLVGGAMLVGLVIGLRQLTLLTLVAVATFLAIPLGIGRSPYDFIMMRYYLPVLPLVTLFAALAMAPLLRRRWAMGLLLLAVVLLAWPAWQVRYTFQDEFDWLREQLKRQPADCTVAQIGVSHHRTLSKDVDCCLDLTRCPLVAELPGRTFALTDTSQELQALTGTCRLYYEGSVCSLQATDEVRQRNSEEQRWFKRACAEVRHTPGLVPIAETVMSPTSHTDAFAGKPVTVRLFRLDRRPQP